MGRKKPRRAIKRPARIKELPPLPNAVLLRGVKEETWIHFAELAEEQNSTANMMMAQLLNRFDSKRSITALLGASISDDLEQLAEAMEAIAWSDHAFGRKHWNWALSRLTKVLEATNTKQLHALSQVARYKLGGVLIEISNRLELHALQLLEQLCEAQAAGRTDLQLLSEESHAKFQSAKQALCYAMVFHEEFRRQEGSDSVVCYNDSCVNALLSRVLVHEWPQCPRATLLKGISALDATQTHAVGQHYELAWQTEIGVNWRRTMPRSRIDLIERFGLQAVTRLEEITSDRTESSGTWPSFWISLAEKDFDLLFLNLDGNFARDVKNWASRYAVRGGEVDPDLESLRALPASLPNHINQRAEALFHGLSDVDPKCWTGIGVG